MMKTFKLAAFGVALTLWSLAAIPAGAADYSAVTPGEIKWMDAPSIGPGAKTATIHGDPKSAGPFVMRIKMPPNSTIKVHTHPATENVTILSGTLYFAAGDKFDAKAAKAFEPGGFFSIDAGKPMFAYSKNKEVVLQLHGNGPWGISYLDPKEAPTATK